MILHQRYCQLSLADTSNHQRYFQPCTEKNSLRRSLIQTHSPRRRRTGCDKISRGRESTILVLFHFPLLITRAPAAFAKTKCRRGLGKDFITLRESHIGSCEETILQQIHQMTDFNGEKLIIKLGSWLYHER